MPIKELALRLSLGGFLTKIEHYPINFNNQRIILSLPRYGGTLELNPNGFHSNDAFMAKRLKTINTVIATNT